VTLPIALSVPHAGLEVPADVAALCALTPAEIAQDGDEGAAEVYALSAEVAAFATTGVARAIVDLNRAEDDRRKDGVVKTHTCWDVPVYRVFPSSDQIEGLLAAHHRPYHARLTAMAALGARLAVDCHTMAAVGPPVAPDPGAHRPWVCLSHANGTCPAAWMAALVRCFEAEFGPNVRVNDPFQGGYITRTHAAEMPWVQLELSRAPFAPDAEKRRRVLAALTAWVRIGRLEGGSS
jgi:formiminoglutamase